METTDSRLEEEQWQAYREALYRFVIKRVEGPSVAEDIVQEVLVKAYTQQDTLRTTSKLKSWLYQITRNTIIDHYRSRRPVEALAEPHSLEQDGAERDEARAELAQCLVPLLETLPDHYRNALRLADFEGVKQREVAARLGLSLSGAKSRVQRARTMLRDALLDCCRVELDHRGHAVDFESAGKCSGCSSCE